MDRFRRNNKEADNVVVGESSTSIDNDPLADIPKSFSQRLMPVMACGAGLFSDGYINNVCDSTRKCFENTLYKIEVFWRLTMNS